MSVHKYTSWGRTRRPKNLAGPDTSEVSVVVVGSLSDATDGYSTENQRFLHLMVTNGTANNASAGVRTVTCYVYNYAFAKWVPLLDSSGSAVALTSPDNDGTDAVAVRKQQVFEIFGVDRIAFVGVTADVKAYAACSTF